MSPGVRELWCELAWLGDAAPAPAVSLGIAGDRIATVEAGGAPPPGAERLRGLTIPGLVNAHSHSFQRALRGRTQSASGGDFWSWREEMYALALRLDPDSVFAVARATFGEMALAGITSVGEFHYLHHGVDGVPYDDPNALGNAIIAAAAEAGVRLTLIDACYLHGGIDRFRDRSAEAWAERVGGLGGGPLQRVGAAIHSVRAVDPAAAATVAAWAGERPLHAHVSEQPAENESCLAEHGLTPTALLGEAGALGPGFTAIHATHPTDADVELLGAARAGCCLCPTTERDLADGIGPARALRDAGVGLSTGSDSQAFIDPFEEARAIELDERLATGVRGTHEPRDLLRAATAGGARAIGWHEAGRIEAGALADLTTISLDGPRLAGLPASQAIPGVVFAAAPPDVRDVMVGGRWIVRDGAHAGLDVAALLAETLPR